MILQFYFILSCSGQIQSFSLVISVAAVCFYGVGWLALCLIFFPSHLGLGLSMVADFLLGFTPTAYASMKSLPASLLNVHNAPRNMADHRDHIIYMQITSVNPT